MSLNFLIKLKIKIFIFFLCFTASGCFVVESFKNQIALNNAMAIQTVRRIVGNQVDYYKANGKFAGGEEITKRLNLDDNNPRNLQKQGYKIELECDVKFFKVWLYPTEYNVTGKISYFFDSRIGKIQGGDHQGGKANEKDPSVSSISDEDLKTIEEVNKK